MNPERTIEELLGLDIDKLRAMSMEELQKWLGDAVTNQEEILKSVPKKTASTKVNLGSAPSKKPAPDYSQLPPEMRALIERAKILTGK